MTTITLPEWARADLRFFITGDEGHAAVFSVRNLSMITEPTNAPDPAAFIESLSADLTGLMTNPRMMTASEVREYLAEQAKDESEADNDVAP